MIRTPFVPTLFTLMLHRLSLSALMDTLTSHGIVHTSPDTPQVEFTWGQPTCCGTEVWSGLGPTYLLRYRGLVRTGANLPAAVRYRGLVRTGANLPAAVQGSGQDWGQPTCCGTEVWSGLGPTWLLRYRGLVRTEANLTAAVQGSGQDWGQPTCCGTRVWSGLGPTYMQLRHRGLVRTDLHSGQWDLPSILTTLMQMKRQYANAKSLFSTSHTVTAN